MTPQTNQHSPSLLAKSYPSTERGTWHYLHTPGCLIIAGERLPYIHKSPLRLHKRLHQPGAQFCYFGGAKHSAGFECLDFRDFEPMTYVGQIIDHHIESITAAPGPAQGSTIALFTQGDKPGNGAFYGWHYEEKEGVFIWATNSLAARVIEHDQTALLGEPGPATAAPPTHCIKAFLAEQKASGADAKTAITRLRLAHPNVRESRRSLTQLFDELPKPKLEAFDPAAFPSWWECPDCWHQWSDHAALGPTCPACQQAQGKPIARWWRADERQLLLRLDATIGIDNEPYPPAPL